MSTILKALQRLDGEKTAAAEPSLDEQVMAASAPETGGRRTWVVIVALAAGIAAGIGVFAFWPESGPLEETQEIAAAPPAEPEVARAVTPAPRNPPAARRERPRRSPARPAPAVAAERAGKASEAEPDVAVVKRIERRRPAVPIPAGTGEAPLGALALERLEGLPEGLREAVAAQGEDLRPATPPPPPRRAALRAPPTAKPEPRPAPPVAAAPSAPVAPPEVAAVAPEPVKPNLRPAAAPAPKPEPVQKQAEPAPPPVKPKATSDPATGTQVQRPSAPNTSLRAQVPTVFVSRTQWHPDRARRVAIVEVDGSGETLELREGDAIGPLVVEEIQPTGVFFGHDGIAIMRRVGAR